MLVRLMGAIYYNTYKKEAIA